jgi:hypothetical protein
MSEKPAAINALNPAIYSTRDLYLAAVLVTLQFYLIRTDMQVEGLSNRPIGYFVFEDTAELRDARQKYMQGMLLIEPQSFVTKMHSLKAHVANMSLSPHEDLLKK